MHLGLVQTSPAGGESAKGDKFNKAVPEQQAPAAPAPAAGEKGACPADKPPMPPAGEGA